MDIKNLVLGIAIFILTMFVGIYGINTFYGKAPDYNTYCPNVVPQNPSECIKANGTWINYTDSAMAAEKMAASLNSPTGYCDVYTYCQKQLEKVEEPYYKGVFIIAIPLGIFIIAIGALVFGLVSVGGGLMFGGVSIIIYGAGSYWRFANDIMKFSLSLAGLVVLIGLAYYANYKWNFFEKKDSKSNEKGRKKK